jgi:hypothetical protein
MAAAGRGRPFIAWVLVIAAGIGGFLVWRSHHNADASHGVATASTANAISPAEAVSHLGANETVAFRVGYTHVDSAGTEFLDQYANYKSGFVVTIFSPTVALFQADPASTYLNQNVAVTGTIQLYDGYYEIVVNDPSQVQPFSGQLPTSNTGTTRGNGNTGTGTTGSTGLGTTGTTGNTGTPTSLPPSAATPASTNLPVSYRYATNTLDWTGFSITAATCSVASNPDGFPTATVTGTAVVPLLPSDQTVVGKVQAWVLDSGGNVIAPGVPWALPQAAGTYTWTVDVLITSSATASSCLVQGIDPNYSYNTPQ